MCARFLGASKNKNSTNAVPWKGRPKFNLRINISLVHIVIVIGIVENCHRHWEIIGWAFPLVLVYQFLGWVFSLAILR
jgi:hypothetical protein